MRWALGSKKYLVYTLTFPLFTGLGWAAGNSPTASGDRSVGGIIGFTAFFAISGFAIAYCAAAYALNICEIRADRTCITYSSGPFRWFRPKSFDAIGLGQFFAKESVRGSSVLITNAVYLIDAQGHAELLCGYLPSTFAMHQTVHELLDFYGLEDMEVYGETHLPNHPGIRTS